MSPLQARIGRCLARLPILATVKDELDRIVARRWRLGGWLTLVMMAAYFGFILLVAFDKPLMGTLIAGGRISVGIVLGVLVIATVPLLTAVYVRWANRHYDPALLALLAERRAPAVAPRDVAPEVTLPPAVVTRANAAPGEVRP